MDFKAGRVDATTANPTGRLPTIKFVANDIRNKFVNDYGLSVRHTVALIGGAHSVAFVSQKNTPEATFNGSIDSTPHTFDNVFFTELKNRQGNKLPTDMELLKDSEMFNAICLYSKNQTLLQHEFIEAMQQLLNLGTIYKPYFTPSNQQMNPQGNYYNPFSPGNNYFPASNGKSYTPVFNGNNDQLKSNNAQTIDGLIQEGYAHNQIYGVSSENHGSLMELNHFFMFTLLFVFQ